MALEQKRIVAEVWSHRAQDTPIKSPYEMLTLASIVEKETGKADERPAHVAGVFVNRLAKGIPLQSDPTIVYGLVGGKATLGRGILKSEIEQRTPYNTYAITGLPPGAICNPGRAAMEAVANPSRTKDIYFVADGTGGHVPSPRPFDQHRQNVQRWRQIEKDAKDKVAPDLDKVIQTTPGGTPGAPILKNQRGDAAPAVPDLRRPDRPFRGGLPLAKRKPPRYWRACRSRRSPSLTGDAALSRFAPLAADQSAIARSGRGGQSPGGRRRGRRAVRAKSWLEPNERALAYAKGSNVTFPVSAAQRADEKARATQYRRLLRPRHPAAVGGSRECASRARRWPRRSPRRVKGRVIDASEGTKLDPLLDKTYDLNYSQDGADLQGDRGLSDVIAMSGQQSASPMIAAGPARA